MAKTNNQKLGDILEDCVALLHDLPDVSVETRVKVEVPNEVRKREVDVLITPQLVGDPVPIVIECKNHEKPIGVGLIDEFVGKLQDIEVPPERGIFVSSMGFSSGAENRAAKAGIQLLRMKGLDESRLAKAINIALLSVIHRVLFVDAASIFRFLPQIATAEPWPQVTEPTVPTVYDEVWKSWVTGELPMTLGHHSLHYRATNGGCVVGYQVHGYVGNISGTSSCLAVLDASTSKIERTRLETKFKIPNSVDLQRIQSEEELGKVRKTIASNSVRVIQIVKVPRIVTGAIYWPPSTQTVNKINELIEAGKKPTFREVEGDDLNKAWDGIRFPLTDHS